MIFISCIYIKGCVKVCSRAQVGSANHLCTPLPRCAHLNFSDRIQLRSGACLRACLKNRRGAAAGDFGRGHGGAVRAAPQPAFRAATTPPPPKRPAAHRDGKSLATGSPWPSVRVSLPMHFFAVPFQLADQSQHPAHFSDRLLIVQVQIQSPKYTRPSLRVAVSQITHQKA